MVQSYLIQLTDQATRKGISLKDAFVNAGVADSTFYRARSGSYDLSYGTAAKVAMWMDEIGQAPTTP